MRRTETNTRAPSLSSRSRSMPTWARAHAVPAARRRNSCIRTYAAAVSRTRNWYAQKLLQLVRSISRSCSSPSSQAPLLGPGPLRTGRETFVLIRLKPFERLFQGDAASIRKGADGEPCRGTLDEVERGCPRSSNHPSQEGRSGEGASP